MAVIPSLKAEVAGLKPDLIAVRRDLHAHPELAFEERRTARLIAERLQAQGLEVQTGVARTGVVGLLRGGQPGITVMVRADIDGLPLMEQNQVEYRSLIPNVMHACGHDGHTAAILGVAAALSHHRARLRGNVKFVFQPAEERADGAQQMIREGVLENPKVDTFLAFHLWNPLPVGKIGVRPGPFWASADEIEIVIKGRGGHGAMPHQGVDAIVVAAQVVTALQTVVSRQISPVQPAVLSIGTVHGGNAYNILAEEVRMNGTVRALEPELRDGILERTEDIVRGICLASRADCEFRVRHGCPAVVNDVRVAEVVRRAAEKVVGPHDIVLADQSMVGDDLAYFLELVPGTYFLVGSGNPDKGLTGAHHSARFDFDEDALPLAAEVMARAVLRCLDQTPREDLDAIRKPSSPP